MSKQISLFLSLITAGAFGSLAVLGWTPWAWWPIAVLSYSVLFLQLVRETTIWRGLAIGFAFGIGLHSTGHGWIFDTLHQKTGLGFVPALLSTALFIAYLAIFTSLSCGLFVWIQTRQRRSFQLHKISSTLAVNSNISLLLAACFASTLSAGEYGRSLLFNGFTSLSLGYALIDTWLAGFGPIGGVYLVGWVGFFCIAVMIRGITGSVLDRLIGGSVVSVIAVAGVTLSNVSWVQPIGMSLSFRLLQTNVAQGRKFDSGYIREQALNLIQLIEKKRADLIVTPETAFPQFLSDLPDGALDRLQKFSEKRDSNLFLGIATAAANSDGYNSVLHLQPKATEHSANAEKPIFQYQKVRLMPFGEYSPRGFDWFTKNLAIPLKDLSSGSENQTSFEVGSQRIGTLICHEDLVSSEALRWVRQATGASILINPSNLAWFEGSIAIEQRLQIVRMRALEIGRPILRVANTGVTAHINHLGKVESRLPSEYESELFGQVQGVAGLTPFVRWGDLLYLTLSLLCVFTAILRYKNRSGGTV